MPNPKPPKPKKHPIGSLLGWLLQKNLRLTEIPFQPEPTRLFSFDPNTPFFERLGILGITLGQRIFLVAPYTTSHSLLQHERTHAAQWRRDGDLFLLKYILGYLLGRRRGLSHLEAYRAIPYETEARDSENLPL